jgi:hypothetical protein
MLMEFIWTLLKIVTMPISYILLGPSDKPHHGLVEIHPAEPNFERVVRWCRIIAGDKNRIEYDKWLIEKSYIKEPRIR